MVHAESGNVGVVSKLLDCQAFMDTQDMVGVKLWELNLQVCRFFVKNNHFDIEIEKNKTEYIHLIETN